MKTLQKKEAYLHTLNSRGNIYEEFVPDQVLTHKNLNKIVNYFEDQDRLSRIHLSGVGIGCGLNITSFKDNIIEIGQGVGVTTDGDLIKSETSEFLYYTAFSDKGEYPLFEGLEVFEIHTQEGAGHQTGELPLSSFNNLSNYMIIAYLEYYTEDEGLCDGFDCDDSGTKVYANLKFLITQNSNYEKLIQNDSIYNNHNVLAYYDGLPELQLPRLLLNKTNTKSVGAVYNRFVNGLLTNNLIPNLRTTIKTIINKLNHRINFEKFGVNSAQIDQLFHQIFGNLSPNFELSIQYKYDLAKDLLETYEQIRDLLLRIHFECVPTVRSFPKHLLIGTLKEETRLQTRHQFYPSPIVTGNDENLMEIKSLIIKFFNQLKQYRIPTTNTAAIKITPSKNYSNKLSLRAIPYYYQTKNSLIKNWNFTDLQNRKSTNQLGYHTSNLKNIPSVQKPLEYTHLDKDFYRIEGHLGKNYKVALNKLNKLKSDNNLAFDVKTISIGFPISSVSFDNMKCENKNYLTLLQTWEKDFSCKADSAIEFFNQYSIDTATIGDNYTSTRTYPARDLQVRATNNAAIRELAKAKSKTGASTKNKKVVHAVSANNTNYDKSIRYVMDSATDNIQGNQYTATMYSAVALEILAEYIQVDINPKDYFLYLENPIKTIANLQVLKRDFLKDLNSFYQTDKWFAFNTALDQLCIDLRKAILMLSKVDAAATFGDKVFDKMYDYFIYELSDFCCLKEKINWLKEQLDELRLNMYKDLILSELIQKHPGIEHMAGVPKGGTFLMVYAGGISRSVRRRGRSQASFNGNILFDFALPYTCYSDCPPETIVYQIDNTEPAPVGLQIIPQKFCFSNQTAVATVPFNVAPAGKELTSPNAGNFIIGNLDNYRFNPNNVPDALLGEPITFIVGGQAIPTSDVQIRAYKLPTSINIFVNNMLWTDAGLEMEFAFDHELDTKTYFNYAWQSNGQTLNPINVSNPNRFLFTSVENTVIREVKLVITVNDAEINCNTQSTAITINETRPITQYTIDIDKKNYCLPNDKEALLFRITPSGVLTSPNGSNFILENQGIYKFNPTNVSNALLGNPITFLVDGNVPTPNIELKVYKIPNITPAYQVVGFNGNNITLRLNTLNPTALEDKSYLEYVWTFQQGTEPSTLLASTKNADNIILPLQDSAINGELTLTVKVVGLATCEKKFRFKINETKPVVFGCEMSIGQRLNTFRINEIAIAVRNEINDPTYDNINSLLVNLINEASQIPVESNNVPVVNLRRLLKNANDLRMKLDGLLNDPRFAAFRNQLFKIDEVIEVVVLELLRCISASRASEVIEDTNTFLTRSNQINTMRDTLIRRIINTSYSRSYQPNAPLIRTGYDNTFV